MPETRSELYVGYLPKAPPGVARFTRRRVALVLALALLVAALLAAAQSPFSKAVFEFGRVRSFEGWIEVRPYPTLVVERPGQDGVSRYLLTASGKRGADAATAGLDGRHVRLQGSLVYRDDQTLVELAGSPIEPLDDGRGPPGALAVPPDVGPRRTLVGEIVDSKCFLGVMKPGNLKPHRACATRCISGGIPPVLLVRDADGNASYYLLTGADGGAVGRRVVELGLVAEPVRITGELVRQGERTILRADPASYERLD